MEKKEDWVVEVYRGIQELFNDDQAYGPGIGFLLVILWGILCIVISAVSAVFGTYNIIHGVFWEVAGCLFLYGMFYYITWNITWTLIVLPVLLYRFIKKYIFKLGEVE